MAIVRRLPALVCALVVIAWPASATAAPPVRQYRAIWVHGFDGTLKSPAAIDRLVADAGRLGLNTLVVQIGRRFDCLCNASSFPRAEFAELEPPPFDPLAYVVERAHANDIRVYAWINSTVLWSSSRLPTNPDHARIAHGPAAPGDESWVTRDYRGHVPAGDLSWIDLGHPAASRYVADGIASIVGNYDVDGINLDYIRYPDGPGTGQFYGYNAVALRRFRAETARTDRPKPDDEQWLAWRRRQVTQLVRRVAVQTFAVKPRVRITADTIVYGGVPFWPDPFLKTAAYSSVLQDWRGWLGEGILDVAMPMNYKVDAKPDHRAWFAQWTAYAKTIRYGRHVVVGTGLYLNTIKGSRRQVRQVVTATSDGSQADGWIGYVYQQPSAWATTSRRRTVVVERLRKALRVGRQAPMPGRALVPRAPWKRTTGGLAGVVRGPDGLPRDGAIVEVRRDGVPVRLITTDGEGWYGAVSLEPATYELAVAGAVVPVTVTAQTVQTADLVAPPA